MFWGWTPALDFCKELKEITKKPLPNRPLHFLIIGGADARHILRTISRLWKHGYHQQLIITVIEPRPELIARQLLLLSIALEPNEKLRPAAKVRFFMELYGNTLLRPAVEKYLTEKSDYLVEFITKDTSPNDPLSTLIDTKALRYKERDYLETLFRFWGGRIPTTWKVEELWDRRVRDYLGTRYDNRVGAFDWDLHMKIHESGGERVSSKEYKRWRENGVAFAWLHTEPSRSNRSLSAGVAQVSLNRTMHGGYLGDIVVGPYGAYGLHCENESLLKKQNNIFTHGATEITEYNLQQLFHELMEGTEYCASGDIVEVSDSPSAYSERTFLSNISLPSTLQNVKIEILSCTSSLKSFGGKCDLVWISQLVRQRGAQEAVSALAPGSVLFAEGVRLDPRIRKEQIAECEKQMHDIATLPGKVALKQLKFDGSKDWYAKFVAKVVGG